MKSSSMKLLNCRRCDDVVKLIEDRPRSCECAACRGSLSETGGVRVTGPARVLEIDYESYDGIAEGEQRPFTVLPRQRY